MRKGDEQIGLPAPVYTDTAANIEALSGVVEGATAYATDTDEPGWYDGAAWTWGAGGSGGGDSTYTAAYASRPAAGNDGDLFLPSDGFVVERDTGAAWVPWGPIFPAVNPVLGDFSWINQGAATAVATNGGIHLHAPAVGGNQCRILKKAAPSTPYTITMAYLPLVYSIDYAFCGVGFRQSSDGKLQLLGPGVGSGHAFRNLTYSSPTSYAGSYGAYLLHLNSAPVHFLRIGDDGTYRTCSISTDGVNFLQFHSVGRTDYLTADEVFFFAESNNASWPVFMTVISWKEE